MSDNEITLDDVHEQSGDEYIELAIANELEGVVNRCLEQGIDPLTVASVMNQYSREFEVSYHRNAVRKELVDDFEGDGDMDMEPEQNEPSGIGME